MRCEPLACPPAPERKGPRGRAERSQMTPAEVARLLGGAGREAVAAFLARQRWFAARGRAPRAVELADWAALADAPALLLAMIVADGDPYYLPVAASRRATAPELEPAAVIATASDTVLHDAHGDPEFGRHLLAALATGRALPGARGRFECRTPGPWPGPTPSECKSIAVHPVGAEQSNTSLRLDRRFILKSLRRPSAGPNPEFEVTHFLATRTSFTHTSGLAGWMDHVDAQGERATVAILQPWVEHEGDGWSWVRMSLQALAEQLAREPHPLGPDGIEVRLRELTGDVAEGLRELGRVTATLHVALASDPSDPDFAPAPITAADVATWRAAIETDWVRTVGLVEARRESWPADIAGSLAALAAAGQGLRAHTAALDVLAGARVHRIRGHGDYHLGQVLRVHGSFLVIDFEGEPARPLPERRARHAALRDVAGMLRSFGYAARSVGREQPEADRAALAPWLDGWERLAGDAFRRGYLGAVGESAVRLVPPGDQDVRAVTAVFELEKALYELRYELGQRPDWVDIPLAALSRLIAPA
jgi:maltose alpha-D-glucosyltransferase/alpha-amylase